MSLSKSAHSASICPALFGLVVVAPMPAEQAYNSIFYIMCGLLMAGLIANLLVKPVHARHHMKETV